MSLTEIQEAIVNLTSEEREELHRWFEQFAEDDWDRQMSADAASDKLDFLANQAAHAKQYGTLKPPPGGIENNT
jgi:hypothetical protein